MRESERLDLEYCAAKRMGEARDLEVRQLSEHAEIKGLLVSLGQSMANVSGALQAHVACSTVTAQRHSDGLVAISRQQKELYASLKTPGPFLAAGRTPERTKTSGAAVVALRAHDGPNMPTTTPEAKTADGGSKSLVKHATLFSPIMEAEMMDGRLASAPIATQLQRIAQFAHVSPGKPGIFGSYVVYGIYESAGIEAAATASPGELSFEVNRERQRRMKNIIMNKADTYVRLLFWMNTVIPEVFATPAVGATVEKMQEFTINKDLCDRLQAALKLKALKAKYQIDNPILTPAKARMSTLRGLLQTLVVEQGYASNVDEMLKTSPFRERLAEASRRIRPRYEAATPQSTAARAPTDVRT